MDKSRMNDQQIEHLIQSSLFNDAAQVSPKSGTFFAIQDRLGEQKGPGMRQRVSDSLENLSEAIWRIIPVSKQRMAQALVLVAIAVVVGSYVAFAGSDDYGGLTIAAEPTTTAIATETPQPLATETLMPTTTTADTTVETTVDPTLVPEATSVPVPTATPSPVPTDTPAISVPTPTVEISPLQDEVNSKDGVTTISSINTEPLYSVLPGVFDLYFDGVEIWALADGWIWNLDLEGEELDVRTKFLTGAANRPVGGPVQLDSSLWLVDQVESSLIRINRETGGVEVISVSLIETPAKASDNILHADETSVWVRHSSTEVVQYSTAGKPISTLILPEGLGDWFASSTYFYFADNSTQEVVQFDRQGNEITRVAIGYKFRMLGATDEKVYVRSNVGGFRIIAPTLTSIEVSGGVRIDYTTTNVADERLASYFVETDDWMWVGYHPLACNEGVIISCGEMVRYTLDGEIEQVYADFSGRIASGPIISAGDYVWSANASIGVNRFDVP